MLTSGNDSEIKFWVPPTKWIGEDYYKPNLAVGEVADHQIKSSIKITKSDNKNSKKSTKSKKKRK